MLLIHHRYGILLFIYAEFVEQAVKVKFLFVCFLMSSKATFPCFSISSCAAISWDPSLGCARCTPSMVHWKKRLQEQGLPHREVFELCQHRTETRPIISTHRLVYYVVHSIKLIRLLDLNWHLHKSLQLGLMLARASPQCASLQSRHSHCLFSAHALGGWQRDRHLPRGWL